MEELKDSDLKTLLELKYQAIDEAKKELGEIATIRNTFIGIQGYCIREDGVEVQKDKFRK